MHVRSDRTRFNQNSQLGLGSLGCAPAVATDHAAATERAYAPDCADFCALCRQPSFDALSTAPQTFARRLKRLETRPNSSPADYHLSVVAAKSNAHGNADSEVREFVPRLPDPPATSGTVVPIGRWTDVIGPTALRPSVNIG